MHKGSDAPSPSPVVVKNEMDISYKKGFGLVSLFNGISTFVGYLNKEREKTANETFYGHNYNRNPGFSVQRSKGHNKNAIRSTDKNVNNSSSRQNHQMFYVWM